MAERQILASSTDSWVQPAIGVTTVVVGIKQKQVSFLIAARVKIMGKSLETLFKKLLFIFTFYSGGHLI